MRRVYSWGWSNVKSKKVKDAETGELYAGNPVYCGRVAIGNAVTVHKTTEIATGEAIAHVTGLQSCRSVWMCPVCSAIIRHRRALELSALIGEHLAAGGGLYMVTLTIRHHQGDDLGALLDMLALAWNRSTASTRAAQEWQDRLGWIGAVKAVEITYGYNGWHPHLHALIFTKAPLTDNTRESYASWLGATWAKKVSNIGQAFVPNAANGVRLEPVRSGEEAGKYLTKVQDGPEGRDVDVNVANELMRGDLKQSRNVRNRRGLVPFQLLDLIGGDDARAHRWALRLWHEYEHATRGKRALTGMSPLLKRYGIGAVTDDEAIEAAEAPIDPTEEPDFTVATLDLLAGEWKALCRSALVPAYLNCVEASGFDRANDVLREAWRWCQLHPPDPERW